jgi:hypothetical protein
LQNKKEEIRKQQNEDMVKVMAKRRAAAKRGGKKPINQPKSVPKKGGW